ncbi:cytochrome P450 [Streptomyces yaizuensis]|uniref:Cytochrome P450 n=1 Tax=Streptomyces yaizuensis TaxID=2989713 RepID=A0ABQ5NXE1_9ACTN|nr:cytochrome P450 [Streptomyces sp. YSPA8]GLF95040.1 cytochrome P450 [Streptomyces sp. YSPA8]
MDALDDMASVPTAAGRLPLIGHGLALARRKQDFMCELAAHGELVRLYLGRLPAYYVHGPELLRHLLVTDARKVAKGWVYDRVRALIGDGLVTAEGPLHAMHRRMIQPAFRSTSIASYMDVMHREATEMARSWQAGRAVAVDRAVAGLAGTVVARSLCSSAHMSPRTAGRLAFLNTSVLKVMSARSLLPRSTWERLPLPSTRRTTAHVAEFHRIVDDLIARYRADGTDHGDLLSVLLAARDADTGAALSDRQIHSEITTLFVAGIETTSAALAGAFHELARNPDIEQRVVAELGEVLAGRPPALGDLPRLDYTRRFLREVLRRYGIWFLMRRAVDDLEWRGLRIPAGTTLLFSPYALHHDPGLYPDPARIDPDRWLEDDLPREAFLPFSTGPRGCLGESFAWAELTVVLAAVLSRWRLRPAPGSAVRHVASSSVRPEPLRMIAEPRRPPG